MNALILRYFWSLIEETQTSVFHSLSDAELVKQLLQQLTDRHLLSTEESQTMSRYINSKTMLIRELVEARTA
jgi:hypothetical protein